MDHTDIPGRVIITWPKPGREHAGILFNDGLAVHDADTGEQLLDVVKFALITGGDNSFNTAPIIVDLTHLTDAKGKPIGAFPNGHKMAYTDEYETWRATDQREPFQGQTFRVATFRYYVVEMRIAS